MTQPHNLADMNRFKFARLDSLASSLAMGAVFLGCLGARAATQQSPSSPIPDAQLQEVVVTGSRISRTDVETASPITVLSRDDLEKSGQQNLAEIIRNISAEGQGSLPTAFTAGFASGASAISLRGLGVNSTLVLVNGRRMAPYGLADDGVRVFTDLNSLPLEAVERIDIVKDGASAVYGSDAIAGVVNVILRKTYSGATITADAGTSYRDDGSTGRVAGSYGFGDLAADKYNVYFTVEVSTQDAIKNTDRPGYLGTENLEPFGYFDGRAGAAAGGRGLFSATSGPNYQTRTPYGTVRVPKDNLFVRTNLTSCPELSQLDGLNAAGQPVKSNICLYDRAQWYQIQPKLRRANLFSRGSFAFNDNLTGYLELGYFKAKTDYIGTPTGFDDAGVYDKTSPTLLGPAHLIFLPAGNPDNPYGVARNLRYLAANDFGGRNGSNDSQVTRFVAGLEGSFLSDWKYSFGGGYVESKLNTSRTGFVRASVLQAAINDGTYRINNPSFSTPATLAAISPVLDAQAKNSLTMIDATTTGPLFHLPGGDLQLAVGAEWRKEKTFSPPTPFTDIGDIIGLGYSTFQSDRKVYAGYVEIDAPIWSFVDLTAAYRYDHYSDYGSSKTPKIGFTLKPIKQIELRGTYSEGFRAPGPAEAGSSISLGFTNIGILSIGNPNLKPEESKSFTFGFVVEPFAGTSASVDYYQIQRKNEIQQADQAAIIGNNPTVGGPVNGQLPGAQPGSVVFYDLDGNLASIAAPYTNASKTLTNGIDFDIRQKFDAGALGMFTASVSWTYIGKFEKTLVNGTRLNYVGTQGPYVLSSASGTPRNRGNFDVTWSQRDIALSGRVNYIGSMRLVDHQGESLVDNGDGTFTTTTGEGSYFVKGATSDANGVVSGAPVCGVYNPNGTPFHNCQSGSFITFDFFGKLKLGDRLALTASILNLTNRVAPFNPYTYGGLNYNPAFTQQGAIGRFVTIGGRYTF